ncbi:D-amino-acid transaminase [Pseudodesulfovibrio cashew]|uniref:branched-chain-amino-acid transaminase n=1 Tax=Pseudodesulfovibrio cashew TaxID=2678688 RepID=A0A6I6JCA4_9BACT|nr:D-amino-acid transaminase [Pseudodesulfovibrio cashew]QGY40425.1 D-amino-acid transaminase [Pseudodesulfovibrio cashew]
MSRTVYINGAFVPEEEAQVSIFDRGFLFADAVYEVTAVLDGKLLEFDGHMARLARSLGELEMECPLTRGELLEVHRELVERNGVEQGGVYLQVTRGAADRDFVFPKNAPQTMVMFTQARPLTGEKKGLKVISTPDIRWGRRDIKTVQLLAASMSKMAAKKQGKDDAWLVEDGFVTEGSSNNTYIVKDNKLVTRHLSNSILPGITRAAVLKLVAELDMEIEERPFTVEEVKQADEAFMTAATSFVCPVVEMDGTAISDGVPGPIAKRLNEIYIEEARKSAI